MLHRMAIVFIILSSITAGCSDDDEIKLLTSDEFHLVQGAWHQKKTLSFHMVSEFRFDQRTSDYALSNTGSVRVYQDKYYVLDRHFPDLHVFDIVNGFEKTITFTSNKTGLAEQFTGLQIITPDSILINDARNSFTYLINSEGHILQIYSIQEPGIFYAPVPSAYHRTDKGFNLYLGIWKGHDLQSIKQGRHWICDYVLGFYDETGLFRNSGIKMDPVYSKLRLSDMRPVGIAIYDNKIFFSQQAIPFISVFDMDFKLVSRFGVRGRHMHPLEKRALGMPPEGKRALGKRQTRFSSPIILDYVPGYGGPVIIQRYTNHNNTESGLTPYWVIYAENGEVLLNDIQPPGFLIQKTGKNQLLIRTGGPNEHKFGLFNVSAEEVL